MTTARGLLPPAIKISVNWAGWPDDEIDKIVGARIAGWSDDQLRQLVKRMVAARRHAAPEGIEHEQRAAP